MKKIEFVSLAALTIMGVATLNTTVHAQQFPNATTGISEVTTSVVIGDDGGPSIPPINPEDPNPPIESENPNPNVGPLSLRYLSNLHFGEVEVSTVAKTIYAEQDKGISGERFDNLVTVQDFRSDNERDGWELTVTMDSEFIPGSQIKMAPFIHSLTAEELALEIPTGELIINHSAQVFARTISNDNPSGISSMGMANPESNGVELVIPPNTPTGEYVTTLTWNLASGPGMVQVK